MSLKEIGAEECLATVGELADHAALLSMVLLVTSKDHGQLRVQRVVITIRGLTLGVLPACKTKWSQHRPIRKKGSKVRSLA